MGHRVAPDPFVDLLAAQHAIGLGEQLQDLELARGQLEALLADVRLVQVRPDRDLADRRARRRSGAAPAAGGGGRLPRSRRSAPRDDRAWSSTRRRRAAGRGPAAPPMTGRCTRSPPGREDARTRARGSPNLRGRSTDRSSTSAFRRMATSVSTVAGLDRARWSHPSVPRRFARTCMKPGIAVDHRHPEPGLGALRGGLPPGLRVAAARATSGGTVIDDEAEHTPERIPITGCLHANSGEAGLPTTGPPAAPDVGGLASRRAPGATAVSRGPGGGGPPPNAVQFGQAAAKLKS